MEEGKHKLREDPEFIRVVAEVATPIITEKLAEQQNEAQTQQQIYKDRLSVAILLSGFATVVSAALSSYLFSIGSLGGVAFFYPTIIGLGSLLFLLHKDYRRNTWNQVLLSALRRGYWDGRALHERGSLDRERA